MNEHDLSTNNENIPGAVIGAPASIPQTVDPVRSAAGRLGAKRVQQLAELGREYEQSHGLKPGRQRRKQMIQLGRRFEIERGLPPKVRRRKGDAWQEFVTALSRVVKPKHRPAVEGLVALLQASPQAKSPDGDPIPPTGKTSCLS
ncbi:hypothetical protein [Zavarzinella formosa]|uniref:hypothetical protein n=1 Tax=Zavarzinella formosa TaxID=360055 RepID=UPI0012F99704|nr:hypothetical protein [Zavarzinella formosa]